MTDDQIKEKLLAAEVKTVKITKNIYRATISINDPINFEFSMDGATGDIAREKLRLSIEGKPYKHLDPKPWKKP